MPKCIKVHFHWHSAQEDPARQLMVLSLAVFRGLTSKGKEGKGEEKGPRRKREENKDRRGEGPLQL